MNVISKRKLKAYYEKNAQSKEGLISWYALLSKNDYNSFHDLKKTFVSADTLGGGITIFNINGNHYRLITHMVYQFKTVFVLWVGSHAEYSKLTEEQIKNLK